ncbi:hypothetical protein KIH41_05440 [Litoribacter ruber]|uniref:Uncharacterized protein n=1 Tax=Litoribacter ruber TaxID=702568 RepID=A0AAP2G452_9BACT|nr:MULTISPECIES: hypothetical protein [Litoribacter]MBS9523118.1 hypothetical protein [Litoribacter alkaliphilus]MBT0810719.1 hypothetical protein [Litoribacter ruber]
MRKHKQSISRGLLAIAFYLTVGLPFCFAEAPSVKSDSNFQLEEQLDALGNWQFLASSASSEPLPSQGEVNLEPGFFASSKALQSFHSQSAITLQTIQNNIWIVFNIKELIFPFDYFW